MVCAFMVVFLSFVGVVLCLRVYAGGPALAVEPVARVVDWLAGGYRVGYQGGDRGGGGYLDGAVEAFLARVVRFVAERRAALACDPPVALAVGVGVDEFFWHGSCPFFLVVLCCVPVGVPFGPFLL